MTLLTRTIVEAAKFLISFIGFTIFLAVAFAIPAGAAHLLGASEATTVVIGVVGCFVILVLAIGFEAAKDELR